MVRKFVNAFLNWCKEDTAAARLERTIAQGVIGVLVGWITAAATNNPAMGMYVAPLTMAILSPIQAALGTKAVSKPLRIKGLHSVVW